MEVLKMFTSRFTFHNNNNKNLKVAKKLCSLIRWINLRDLPFQVVRWSRVHSHLYAASASHHLLLCSLSSPNLPKPLQSTKTPEKTHHQKKQNYSRCTKESQSREQMKLWKDAFRFSLQILRCCRDDDQSCNKNKSEVVQSHNILNPPSRMSKLDVTSYLHRRESDPTNMWVVERCHPIRLEFLGWTCLTERQFLVGVRIGCWSLLF